MDNFDLASSFNKFQETVSNQVAKSPKTPYQQNVSQPVPQSVPTTRQALGQIYLATTQDQAYGQQLQNQFVALQNDPGSIYYNKYAGATNKSIAALHNLGIEGDINDDWYNETSFMDRYLVYNGQTNTPSAPTKKSSLMEQIAYQRNQYGLAMEQTNKAKQECAALQEEIGFLVNWQDRNYSDDDIVSYIYGNDGAEFAKKYPTLAKMDETRDKPAQNALEFNEAIPYSKDWVYGNIWAARNGGGTGNSYRDIAMSALGQGNQWQENANVTGRLVWGSDNYAPYTVGSTTDDVCMYFGVTSYDKEWLNQHIPDTSDKTAVDMWNKAYEAADFTEKANDELVKFNERLDKKLENAKNPDDVMKLVDSWLNSEVYTHLAKMDKSTEKINELVDTSSAIDFSRYDIRRRVEEACAKNANRTDGGQTMENNGLGTGSEQSAEVIKAGDQNVTDAADIIQDQTTAEQNAFNNTPSSWFERVFDSFQQTENGPFNLLSMNEGTVITDYTNNIIPIQDEYKQNTDARRQLNVVNAELEPIQAKKDAIDALGDITSEQYTNLLAVQNDPNWAYYEEILANPQRAEIDDYQRELYDNALVYLYQRANANDQTVYGFSDMDVIRDKALHFYDVLQNNGDLEPLTEQELARYEDLVEARDELTATVDRTAAAEDKLRWNNFMWDARILAYKATGLDATGLETARAVGEVMPFFADYEKSDWNAYNPYDAMMRAENEGKTFDEVKDAAQKGNEDIQKELDAARFIREYCEENDVQLPENYMNNLDRHIAKLERYSTDYNYFTIQGNDDFAEYAAKGRQMDSELPRTQQLDYEDSEGFSYGAGMEDVEKDTYFYLLAKEGKDAATRYWAHLNDPEYGVMNTRNMQKVEEQARALANEHPVLANALAVLSAPAEALLGAAYMGVYGLSGMELTPDSPLLSFGKFSQFVNEQTSTNIKESVPEGPLQDLALGFYEIAYNQSRSMANSFYTGGLKVGGRFGNILTEMAGAAPMATGAAALAVADAKSKGATDGEAFVIGAVTFGMEDFSEGLTRSNIQSAFTRGGKEEVAVFAKQKVKEWLLSSGFEEAFGETLTDVVENEVEKNILGERSDHAAKVREYIEKNKLNPDNPVDMEEAENAVWAEEIAGYAHTAIISYLSPGFSVAFSVGKEGVSDFSTIRAMTREQQKQGISTSMRQVKKDYYTWKDKAIKDFENGKPLETRTEQSEQAEQPAEQEQAAQAEQTGTEAENPNFAVEDVDADALFNQQNNEVSEQETSTAAPETPSQSLSPADTAFLNDLGKLDAVANADTSTQAGAIGALFGGQTNTPSGDIAKAAAANITGLFGSMQNAVSQIKNIITGGHIERIDHNAIKTALQNAALSVSSNARQVVESEEFKDASPMEQAQMLAETAEADSNNPAVQEEVQKSVYENRVAEAEADLIREGALDEVKAAQEKADQAKQNVAMAQESLEEKHGELQAKSDALQTSVEAFNQNPSADNQHALDRAANEYEKADAVAQEYEQHLANVQRALITAVSAFNEANNNTMRNIRAQAETMVTQQDQQRGELAAQAQEQRRIAEEQAAAAQAQQAEAERQQMIADKRSGKTDEEATRARLNRLADQRKLTGEAKEKFVNDVMNFYNDVQLGKIDLSKQVGESEGYLLMGALSRRFGVNIQIAETNGENGWYDPSTNTITLNSNLPAGQVLLEFALHELPHTLEQTGAYQKYQDFVLGLAYPSEAELNNAVAGMVEEREKAGHPITPEQAKRELVSEFTRTRLNDKDVVYRMVDAGLGGRVRNALHNINQFLRNITKRMTPEQRQQAEGLRKAERMLQRAIRERANGQNETAQTETEQKEYSAGTGELTPAQMQQTLDEINDDYMDAVDDGNMEAAQEYVDKAAEQAGYVKAAYHGTLNKGFTVFDKAHAGIGGNSGAGFYFSDNVDDSEANYRDVEGADNWFKANNLADRILEDFQNSEEETMEYEGYEITEGMPYKEVVEIAKKILTKNPGVYNVYLDPGNAYIRDFNRSTNLLENAINGFDESLYDRDDYENDEDYEEAIYTARSDELYEAISNAVYNGIADVESNYEIYSNVNYEDIISKLSETALDYETLTWDDLIKVLSEQYIDIGTVDMAEPTDGSHEIARAIVEAFGFDSIEDREVSKKFNQLKNMGNTGDTVHYIMFSPEQIKLSDPVTYDNNGNVIPLGERFSHGNLDIRYSTGNGELTDAEKANILSGAGAISMDDATRHLNPNGKVLTGSAAGFLGGSPTSYSASDGYIKFANAPSRMIIENMERIGMIYHPNGQYWTSRPSRKLSADVIVKAVQDGDKGIRATIPTRTRVNTPAGAPAANNTQTFEQVQQAGEQLLNGTNAPGEIATNPNSPQRQFGAVTIQRSDEVDEQVRQWIAGVSGYDADTNAAQLNRALAWIHGNATAEDPLGFKNSMMKVTSGDYVANTKDAQAQMYALLGMAIAQKDAYSQAILANTLNQSRTGIAQALQAGRIFRLMTPEGRVMSLQKMIADQQAELAKKGIQLHDENGNPKELTFSEWIYRAAAAAASEEDFQQVQQAAAQELAAQLPMNWKDRISSLRMLSMLANPRTHVRNIIGNMLFIPAVGLKNKLSAIGEIITRQDNRTKTLAPLLSRDARAFARADAKAMKDVLRGEAKYNETGAVQREQKAFKGLVQALIDVNSAFLEGEDWIFLKGHYRRALGGWMQANGYTAEQLQNNPELLEQGREYAALEAQKATYRDFNQFAATLNNVSRAGGVGGFLVDAVLPFKKTPANILRRGIEYSPVGLMRSLTADMYHLKQWKDYQDGKLTALPEKALSPTQVIDKMCSGLSGSLVLAFGAFLSRLGLVSCGLTDDGDELEKEKGNQKYSLNLKFLGIDGTYTIDWAAPMSMPLFVGAAINEMTENEGPADWNELLNAFGNIAEPVFQLSMLDGINSLFKTSQYDDTDALTQILAKIGTNYVTSYVPSILGAYTRTRDDTTRKAFVPSGQNQGIMGTINYAIEQVENKIPGLSTNNIPMRNIWGEAKTASFAERLIENFISPGYFETYKEDPILNEMGRLFDVTGDASIIPGDPPKSFKYNKENYILTDKQWDAYKEARGRAAHSMLEELVTTEDYINASDATQAQMMKNVWSYADKIGKAAAVPDYKLENLGDNPVGSIAYDAKIAGYKDEMIRSLENGDFNGYENMVELLRQNEIGDSVIKDKIANKYRDIYKDAYLDGDEGRMADIVDMLDNTGFVFDYAKWEEQADEKYGK